MSESGMLHSPSTASNLRFDHLAPGSMTSHGMVRAKGSLSEERAKTSEQAREDVADDRFGAAFFMDSGSSCGEIAGHAKVRFMRE